ncbi:unnamed protein product [Ectocarpus sp. CCAP 1310/34]|nr:unnamed protein product [Ectocarpus sp. CCAP 1310/34]
MMLAYVAVHHRKLRVQADPSCFDLSTVLEPVRTEYPNLIYLGIWFHDGSVYVYVQSAERMSDIKLTSALKDHMVITNIAPYSIPLLGSCNRSGDPRLEFIADLLNTLHGVDVFYKFGIKLYVLEQNVNFRARKGDKRVSGVLPSCHIDHFEKPAESILDSKDSLVPEQRKLYERMRNKVLNNIAVNVTDNLSRLSN